MDKIDLIAEINYIVEKLGVKVPRDSHELYELDEKSLITFVRWLRNLDKQWYSKQGKK